MDEGIREPTTWYYYEITPPGQQRTFTKRVRCTLGEVYKEHPDAEVRGNIVYITRSTEKRVWNIAIE